MLTGFELRPSRCTSFEPAPAPTSGIWKLIWLLEAYSIGAGDPLMKTVAPAREVARGTAVADAAPRARFSPKMLTSAPGATEPRKRLAWYAHAPQAPDKFYALQSQVTRFRGVESGYLHAEAYVRHAQSRESVLP